MASSIPAPESKTTNLWTSFTRMVSGTAVGALLGSGYGTLVMGSHFVTNGRLDRGPSFALSVALAGAALGLVAGVVLAFLGGQHTSARNNSTAR